MANELKKYMAVAVGLAEKARNKMLNDPGFDVDSNKRDVAVFQLLIELMKEQVPNESPRHSTRQAR